MIDLESIRSRSICLVHKLVWIPELNLCPDLLEDQPVINQLKAILKEGLEDASLLMFFPNSVVYFAEISILKLKHEEAVFAWHEVGINRVTCWTVKPTSDVWLCVAMLDLFSPCKK